MCEIVRSEDVRCATFRDLSSFTSSSSSSSSLLWIFVATWNVGGRAPHGRLNLEDLLKVEGPLDIYVLGFQEIVPLNAGNVLVVEDNEPAARWLSLIGRALNSAADPAGSSGGGAASEERPSGGHLFFQRPSLKLLSRSYRADGALLKACNCRRGVRELGELIGIAEDDDDDSGGDSPEPPWRRHQAAYRLISSKQMVGIFLSVWVRRELLPYVGHLRSATVGRGIMGRLGNKGCIAISMSVHQTSFCFVCSHLASGEKEGDELRRNLDVAEILKNTQFPRVCKSPLKMIPERILQHDRVIWFGDLNYRVALSYAETKTLLEENDWDALLQKDQLVMEKEAGRVFRGWNEGKIHFAPTYKYTHNSDSYAGETVSSKKKRRTPAWCDRILWHGKGIEQLAYIRGESRFSDHRPVCGVFLAEVEETKADGGRYQRRQSDGGAVEELDGRVPHGHGFYYQKIQWS
ncbi:unnamed protein product [Spirodela intermedia]|uniref:Inositol polyphosphate-related phosphatase domain-containing protein n=1 Tax=Spirodela intermedia TaxID=51605 RepID=A0A7I8KTA6_SPIIN|nr:unnamed protein product [Spirodela intermedia]